MIRGYVLGFYFSEDLDKVLLILKNRPPHLANKLNGVGGKLEERETELDAMVREFKEETGVTTLDSSWKLLNVFDAETGGRFKFSEVKQTARGYWLDKPELSRYRYPMWVFYAKGDVDACKTMTDEPLHVVHLWQALRQQEQGAIPLVNTDVKIDQHALSMLLECHDYLSDYTEDNVLPGWW
jgi:8-oxo-dGTP pyrophosphatase MutT (NUDIX family)